MNINLVCENCNEEFSVPYKQRNKKFCGRECYFDYARKNKTIGKVKDLSIREVRNCLICNGEFEVKKANNKKLCSDECRAKWGSLEENKKIRIKKAKEALLEKYGTDNPFELDHVKDKTIKTNIEKYGHYHPMKNENFKNNILDKMKKTLSENKDEVIKKREETKEIKYGDKNFNNKEKTKNTIKERYGDFHLKKEEYIKKQKETLLKKYGVDSPFKLEKSKINNKKAIIEKYGVEFYAQSEVFKNKANENRLATISKRMDGLGFTLLSENIKKGEHAKLKCNTCNNIFESTQFFRNYEIKCPKCFPLRSNNNLNLFFEEILDRHNIIYMKNNRSLIRPLELDYYLPDYNLAFELNGNYYHSEYRGGKLKNYHLNKSKLCNEKGIKLIQIFEDEIVYKKEIVESKILSSIGRIEKNIYARKTVVKDISNLNIDDFLKSNHIQGTVNSKIKIGLYENDLLVFVVSFGKPRMDKSESTYEIYRSCSLLNTTVVGGFGKCLKFFIEKYKPKKIISYADIRWSGLNPEKTVYSKNDFKFVNNTPPNYWYVWNRKYLNRLHRFVFRKSKLVSEGFDKNKTEKEIMKERGFDLIWDCGSMKFELLLD